MASLRVDYHPGATKELAEALQWYGEQDIAVAGRFGEAYVKQLNAVARSPHRWARHWDGTRHVLLTPFSYSIIVRVRRSRLQVIAVAHSSRRPGYWRKRLREGS